jgi:uncharacterized protein (DUF608 family)
MRANKRLYTIAFMVLCCLVSRSAMAGHNYNGPYTGKNLDRVAFPMGGIGAGMICLEGTGALSHWSLKNKPDIFREHQVFAALCIKGPDGNRARVLEGPIPNWKIFSIHPGTGRYAGPGHGLGDLTYGLPRFREAAFAARFPFARVTLTDAKMSLRVEVTGWSPFTPPDTDASSLPMVGLEYQFHNMSDQDVEAVFSFNARNIMKVSGARDAIRRIDQGFILAQPPSPKIKAWDEGYLAVFTDNPATKVNCAWFRGGWYDSLTMAWKDVQEGKCYERAPVSEGNPAPGASLFVPLKLKPGQNKTVRLQLCWYTPYSNVRAGGGNIESPEDAYRPWYAGHFPTIDAVVQDWRNNYPSLRAKSKTFSNCFYDTSLPTEAVEAVAANMTIIKSPTVLRQTDGKLWSWEGCFDAEGCCHGSCTHVWNYAQAIPHLFPALERTLRDTEFCMCQNPEGHQNFRCPLPIREAQHGFHAAADGQLGCIMKVYRDWRISGDTAWMKELWPKIRDSLDYCINTWDPQHQGVLAEPHHNTYDIEFWGPDPMCSSFYLGALEAAVKMGKALGEYVALYQELATKGQEHLNRNFFNGEYFFQQIQTQGLRAQNPAAFQSMQGHYSPEALALLKQEGPKYQYGKGCLADGVLGAWLAKVSGVGNILDPQKVTSHLLSLHRYNLKRDLSEHANPQRPGYAMGDDGGLIICTWPKGDALSLPFVYSNEVWTGIEYQVASHLILQGQLEQGLDIVRTVRDRYNGTTRNPFNEYECGHWYARAMSSYALLGALSGARYDAVDKTLYLRPALRGDFRAFISTATGYGTVGVKDGKPFCQVVSGRIPYTKIDYQN